MLIPPNKMKLHTTEWENLDKLETAICSSNQKTSLKSKAETQVLDEYEQFLSTITEDCIKQVKIFSKLQQSNVDVFYNYLSMWNNFFHLNFDASTKLTNYECSKFFHT